jgi:hypothetical protein
MREVIKEQFFDVIGPIDVHPNHQNPNHTVWEAPNRQVIGKTIPGWKNYYVNGVETPKQYFLTE